MIQRIVATEHIHQHLPVSRAGGKTRQRLIAGEADLPQNQVRGRVQAATIEHELAGFVVLAAIFAGIEAQVGVQTIGSRHARLHVRLEAFAARDLDGFVRRQANTPGWP